MSASVVLAALSKGSGLVVFVVVTATLVHAVVGRHLVPALSRAQLARLAAGFVVLFLVSVVALGSYRANWEDTGNPFAINGPRARWPDLIERSYVYRPGATSIADTYFTFRFVDMLEQPWITNDPAVYPLHRTSLWSQLYGRAHVAHFAQHPPSWKSTSFPVVTVTRLILLLALLPTALLTAGLTRACVTLVRGKDRTTSAGEALGEELLTLTGVGFIAFVIVYTLSYRDFSTMKAEFLFPALLAYAVVFATEVERDVGRLVHRPALGRAVRYAFGGLLALYVADTVILASQLTSQLYERLG
jgi:hypothetical protein